MTHPSRVSGSVCMDGHASHKLAIAVRCHAAKAVPCLVLCGGRVLPRLEKHSPVVFRPVVPVVHIRQEQHSSNIIGVMFSAPTVRTPERTKRYWYCTCIIHSQERVTLQSNPAFLGRRLPREFPRERLTSIKPETTSSMQDFKTVYLAYIPGTTSTWHVLKKLGAKNFKLTFYKMYKNLQVLILIMGVCAQQGTPPQILPGTWYTMLVAFKSLCSTLASL